MTICMRNLRFFPLFIVFFALALLLFIGALTGLLTPVSGFFESAFLPFARTLYSVHKTSVPDVLTQENQSLHSQLAHLHSLEQDNAALHDQFQAQKMQSSHLLPARIVGAPGFLPGNSAVETYIIDKGKSDGIKPGEAVVYKDSVVGKISQVSVHLSVVTLITNKASTFAAQTSETKSLGVIIGLGNEAMLLTNVVLSDSLKKGDLVMTKGDINSQGIGYPPGLIVGKIIAIDKRSSALFQAAAVETQLDFSKLTQVFIIKTYE